MTRQGKVKVGPEEISSLEDLQKLRGRYFPDQVVGGFAAGCLLNRLELVFGRRIDDSLTGYSCGY